MGASKGELLDEGHWHHEGFKQRITSKQWKELLLDYDDHIIFEGQVRKLVGRKLFPGVIEISKESIAKCSEV